MKNKQLKRTIQASIANAKNVVSELLNFLINERIPLSENDLFDLKLVFSELIYNAVIHGDKENISKKVDIDLLIFEDRLSCKISDEGSGFNYSKLISSFEGNDIDLFNEHGRGVRLALSLVDELNFNDAGNSIKFSKRLNVHG